MVLNKVIMLGNIRRNCKNEKGCTRSFLQRFIDLICLEYVFCSGCCLKGGNGSQEKTWCMKSTENAKRKPGGKKSRNFTTESVNAMEVKVYYCNISSNPNSAYSTLKTTPTPSLPIDPKQKCGNTENDYQIVSNNRSDIVVSENPLITPNETIEKLLEETINKHKQTLCETKPPASLKKVHIQNKEKVKCNALSLFLCCLGLNTKKGATSKDIKSTVSPQKQTVAFIASSSKDFESQYSLKSSQSLEIFSHALTRSTSQLSSLGSILSLKWKRRFHTQPKKPSALQLMYRDFSKKIRAKKDSRPRDRTNVVVLGIPKQYEKTASLPSDKITKPLLIRNSTESTVFQIDLITKPRNKICGPGEVLVKKN